MHFRCLPYLKCYSYYFSLKEIFLQQFVFFEPTRAVARKKHPMSMANSLPWHLGFFMMAESSSLVCLLLATALPKIFLTKYACAVKASVSITTITMERSTHLMYPESSESDSNLQSNFERTLL